MVHDERIREYLFWTEVLMECRKHNDDSAECYCIDILDTCWYNMTEQECGIVNLKVLNLYADEI